MGNTSFSWCRKNGPCLVLEEGKTLMEGPHAELMAEEPRYKRLYQLDRPMEL